MTDCIPDSRLRCDYFHALHNRTSFFRERTAYAFGCSPFENRGGRERPRPGQVCLNNVFTLLERRETAQPTCISVSCHYFDKLASHPHQNGSEASTINGLKVPGGALRGMYGSR